MTGNSEGNNRELYCSHCGYTFPEEPPVLVPGADCPKKEDDVSCPGKLRVWMED